MMVGGGGGNGGTGTGNSPAGHTTSWPPSPSPLVAAASALQITPPAHSASSPGFGHYGIYSLFPGPGTVSPNASNGEPPLRFSSGHISSASLTFPGYDALPKGSESLFSGGVNVPGPSVTPLAFPHQQAAGPFLDNSGQDSPRNFSCRTPLSVDVKLPESLRTTSPSAPFAFGKPQDYRRRPETSPSSLSAPGLLRIKREPAACQVAEVTTSAQPPHSLATTACSPSPGTPCSSASSPLMAKESRAPSTEPLPMVPPPAGSPFQMVQDPRAGRYLFIPPSNLESMLWASLAPSPTLLLPQPLCPSSHVGGIPHLMTLPPHMIRGLVPQLSPIDGSPSPFASPADSKSCSSPCLDSRRSPLYLQPSCSPDYKQPGLTLLASAAHSSPLTPFLYDRSPIPPEPDSRMTAPTYFEESGTGDKLSDSAYGTASCTDVSSDHIVMPTTPPTPLSSDSEGAKTAPQDLSGSGIKRTTIHISDSEVTTTTVVDGNAQAWHVLSPASSQSVNREKDLNDDLMNDPVDHGDDAPLDCRVFIGREKQDATMQTDTMTSLSSDESDAELTEEGSLEPIEERICEPLENEEGSKTTEGDGCEDLTRYAGGLEEEPTEEVSVRSSQVVDRSGLDLLVDSIEQMEKSRKLEEEEEEAVKMEVDDDAATREESPLQNGLSALCEYAERCFKEEVESGWQVEEKKPLPEKLQVRRNSDLNRNYSSPEAELGVKKFLAARQDPALSAYSALGIQVDPIQAMGENELQMRNQLAELQRKYKEKQWELSKLTPRKSTDTGDNGFGSICSPAKKSAIRAARTKKKSSKSHKHRKHLSSKHRDHHGDLPPPVLERVTDEPPSLPPKLKWSRMDAPPTLTPSRSAISNGVNGSTGTIPNSPPPALAPLTPEGERQYPPCRLSLVKLPSVNNQKRRWSVDCHPPPPLENGGNTARIQTGASTESSTNPMRRDSVVEKIHRTFTPSAFSHKSSTNYRLPDVYEWSQKRKVSSSSLESASKKRKVGRPKKHCFMLPSTETIVSKKSHSKSSIVGYLLGKPAAAAAAAAAAARNGSISRANPTVRTDSATSDSGSTDSHLDSYKAKENLDKSISSPEHGDTSPHHRPKIRPKLKAEVKVKETWEDDDVLDWSPGTKYQGIQSDPLRPVNKFVTNRHGNGHGNGHKEQDEEWLPKKARTKPVSTVHPIRSPVVSPVTNHQRLQPKFAVSKVAATAVRSPLSSVKTPTPSVAAVAKIPTAPPKIINGLGKSVKKPTVVLAREKRLSMDKPIKKPVSIKIDEENGNNHAVVGDPEGAVLTDERLMGDKLPARTLTAKGGLFYAGQLSAVRPPDLYSILLDGERASRPNICSREEILQETILEVRPSSAAALPLGCRVCAYWSQQYRCLYPGTIAEPPTPDPELDDEFVNVEFDDGDSGRINIRDIRLLPPDYPIVVNDPNPLLTLGKRRRRNSASMDSKDRRSSAECTGSTSSMNNGTDSGISCSHTTESERECSTPEKQPSIDNLRTNHTNDGHLPSSPSGGAMLNKHSPQVVLGEPISPQMLEEMERKRLKKRRREKLKRLRNASSASLSSDINGSTPKEFVKKHKHKHHKHHKRKKHRHHNGTNISNGCQNGSAERVVISETPDKEGAPVLTSEDIGAEECPVPALTAVVAPLSISEEPPVLTSPFVDEMPVLVKPPEKKLKLSIKKVAENSEVNGRLKGEEMSSDDNEKENGVVKKESKETSKQKKKSLKKDIAACKTDKADKPESPTKNTKKVATSGTTDTHSKMAAFLPVQKLWAWSGKGHKRPGSKGKGRKEFYKCIQRGDENISVGDCAVFLSTGQPDQPFIGRIEALWEAWNSNKVVRVKWFYHPQETIGCPASLKYPGALFESDHCDENDVQTIARKCLVLPVQEYASRISANSKNSVRDNSVRDNTDVYYLAGFYDPSNQLIKLEKGVV